MYLISVLFKYALGDFQKTRRGRNDDGTHLDSNNRVKVSPSLQSLTALPLPLALITNQGDPHKIPTPPQMKDTFLFKRCLKKVHLVSVR